MSFYELARREMRKGPSGIPYRVEVWRGHHGYVADIYPKGSNEPVAKRYANSAPKAWQLALRWLEANR